MGGWGEGGVCMSAGDSVEHRAAKSANLMQANRPLNVLKRWLLVVTRARKLFQERLNVGDAGEGNFATGEGSTL